jgi:hypothetical protein
MHYASTYFSNGEVNAIGTTWPLAKRNSDGSYSRIYNRGVLSDRDVKGVQRLYGFAEKATLATEPALEFESVVDPGALPVDGQ